MTPHLDERRQRHTVGQIPPKRSSYVCRTVGASAPNKNNIINISSENTRLKRLG
jgi:hypothetical protein